MNPLIDDLPTKIKVNDEIIEINANFRNCLKIILAYEDKDLTIQEKHYIMLRLLYKKIPNDVEKGILQGIKFLNCGEENSNIKESKRVYSFQKDAKFIYSAVSQSSNIDLETVQFLHWWKFNYYFLDISNDCTFSNIINLRRKKNNRKLTDEERKLYMDSLDILDLDYEEQRQESAFMKAFNGGE